MSLWIAREKSIAIIIAAVCFAFVFLGNTCLAFAGSAGLDGKWETNVEVSSYRDKAIIEFSGNNFSITDYLLLFINEADRYSSGAKSSGLGFSDRGLVDLMYREVIFGRSRVRRWSALEVENFMKTIDDVELVKKEEHNGGRYKDLVYRFFTKGTYSVTDREIELLYSDGSIKVKPFSRTENTISIDEKRFTRVRN